MHHQLLVRKRKLLGTRALTALRGCSAKLIPRPPAHPPPGRGTPLLASPGAQPYSASPRCVNSLKWVFPFYLFKPVLPTLQDQIQVRLQPLLPAALPGPGSRPQAAAPPQRPPPLRVSGVSPRFSETPRPLQERRSASCRGRYKRGARGLEK